MKTVSSVLKDADETFCEARRTQSLFPLTAMVSKDIQLFAWDLNEKSASRQLNAECQKNGLQEKAPRCASEYSNIIFGFMNQTYSSGLWSILLYSKLQFQIRSLMEEFRFNKQLLKFFGTYILRLFPC